MDNKFIKKVGWIIFGVGVIMWTVYYNYIKTLEYGRGYLIKKLVEFSFLFAVTYIFFYKTPRERAIKISQYVGFSCFFLWILLGKFLPSFLREYLLIFGLIGIAASLYFKKDVSSKKGGKTLEEKIKNQLKINSKGIKMYLPKRIGGFVFPMFPFFHITSNRWKGNLKEESIIHENVHLYYLQNGWLVFIIIGIILVLAPVKDLLSETMDMNLVVMLLFIVLATLFEYVTFNKTHEIGNTMGITTRQWNKKLAFKYFILYSLQFIFVFFAYEGIKFIVMVIGGWL